MSEEEEFEAARGEMKRLMASVRSCILATVSSLGQPLSSYAPVWVGESGAWYVYVSAMAKHYGHLRKACCTSALLLEDEAVAESIFARRRLAVDCSCTLVERDSEEWLLGTGGLEERHGETMGYLKGLTDFDLFRLEPSEGRLVLGFGKAYRVSGKCLGEISYVRAGGHKSGS